MGLGQDFLLTSVQIQRHQKSYCEFMLVKIRSEAVV